MAAAGGWNLGDEFRRNSGLFFKPGPDSPRRSHSALNAALASANDGSLAMSRAILQAPPPGRGATRINVAVDATDGAAVRDDLEVLRIGGDRFTPDSHNLAMR